jgi:cytochrome c-type biogenesis protein CcmH
MRHIGRLATPLFVVLLAAVLAVSAHAQGEGITDDQVNAVAKNLYCPVCENIPLDACGTPACIQWRAEIRAQLEEGKTEDEIIADFVARYGERVVGTPQSPVLRTLSLVTPWIIGVVALVVAAATVIRWQRQRRQPVSAGGQPASGGPTATDDVYRARVERDVLARR